MSSSNEQLPAPTGSPPRSPEDDSKTKGKYRFEVAVLTLATMIFAVCILQALATSEFFIVRLGVLPFALFLTFFGYEASNEQRI
uniref:Tripartite tricarboxylate transporter TctB family protein n=1 Tax=Meloidogyne hapla TaxID=6305 RepID=A0A1I8BHL5_MELHA